MLMMLMVGLVVSMCACICVITCMQSCCTCPLSPWIVCRGDSYIIAEHGPNCLNAGKYTGKYPPHPTLTHTHTQRPPLLSLPVSHRLPHKAKLHYWRRMLLQPDHKHPRWTAAPRQNKESGGKASNSQLTEKKRSSSHNKHKEKWLRYVESSRAGAHMSYTQSTDLHPQ